MFISVPPTNDDVEHEKLLEEAKRRVNQTCVEYIGAIKAKIEIERTIIFSTLWDRGIRRGNRVVVDFKEGSKECIYEGISTEGVHAATAQIILRHLTKSGKPRKHADRYAPSCTQFIHRVEQNS